MAMLKINFIRASILAPLFFSLSGCDSSQQSQNTNTDTLKSFNQLSLEPKAGTQRWYFTEQAERGRKVFAENCAVCHGKKAESTPHWRTRDASNNYPPPPLNGSAHTWHHPLSVLGRTIYHGGALVGGQMPAFKDRLSEIEIVDVIAHIQSYWRDDIYDRWLEIENSSRN